MYYNLKAHSENLKYNLNNGLTKSNIHNVLYLANEIKSISETIIENLEYTEKKTLKKHTMNLRPRKNKAVGSVDVIGEAPPYPYYNQNL